MTDSGVIPHHDRPREVGRVTGPTTLYTGAGAGKAIAGGRTAALRVAVHNGRVQLAIGVENVWLDAEKRDEFMRLFFAAERQVEASDE